jgi:hypothetical protein
LAALPAGRSAMQPANPDLMIYERRLTSEWRMAGRGVAKQ